MYYIYIYPFQGDDFRTFVNMVTRSALFCSLLKFCLQRNPLSVNKKHAQFYGFLETPVKDYFKFSWIELGIADKKLFTACQKGNHLRDGSLFMGMTGSDKK